MFPGAISHSKMGIFGFRAPSKALAYRELKVLPARKCSNPLDFELLRRKKTNWRVDITLNHVLSFCVVNRIRRDCGHIRGPPGDAFAGKMPLRPKGTNEKKLTRFLSFSLENINFALAKGVCAS
jgi:hypothetical protein